MPTCRVSLRSPLIIQRSTRSHCHRSKTSTIPTFRGCAQRRASTAAALAKPIRDAQPERSSVRTVLHKAESLLPRVLSIHDDPSAVSSLKFWQEVLHRAYGRLNNVDTKGAARIVGTRFSISTVGCSQLITLCSSSLRIRRILRGA